MNKETIDKGNDLLHDMRLLTEVQSTMSKKHWVGFVRAEFPHNEPQELRSDEILDDFKNFVAQELEKATKLFNEL